MLNSLFSPFQLKKIGLKNRIVMPGLASFLIDQDGFITNRAMEHYRRRAAGGPGMVIMEACGVSPEGIVSPHQARIYDDCYTEGLYRIAKVMKAEGTVPAVQLHHGGRQISARVIKRKPLAPSNLPCPAIKGEVEPLTVEGIQELVHKFGDGAVRAVEAGYQLIELHGAHGYLINQFLSGFSNIRDDDYGGDTLRRSRFAEDIVKEIRSRIGTEFPLSFKISAQEFVPGGLTVEESIVILKRLVAAGIDIVQVSAGNDATPEWVCQPMFMKKAFLADSAEVIKKALNIPIMVVGRINDPIVANDIIEKEKADLVCIGRGLLADPEMPKKAQEGRLEDIQTCIACNTCMESIYRKGRVECTVNPTISREKEMVITPTEHPKKVMVIGGGPSGMNVAWVAAKRGHKVVLYEKEPVFGGQLILGSITEYKKELLTLIAFQKTQVRKTGVECHFNCEVTLETVREMNPDVVILATGSVPITPPIPGIDSPTVIPLNHAFNTGIPPFSKIVVIGGGATGCEVALHLSASGCHVIVVEKLPKIGLNIESVTRKMIMERLRDKGVEIITDSQISRITEKGAYVMDKSGNETFLEAERVITTIGNRSYNSMYDQIKSLGIPVFQIGDCLEPRSAKAAIYEGAVIGRAI